MVKAGSNHNLITCGGYHSWVATCSDSRVDNGYIQLIDPFILVEFLTLSDITIVEFSLHKMCQWCVKLVAQKSFCVTSTKI